MVFSKAASSAVTCFSRTSSLIQSLWMETKERGEMLEMRSHNWSEIEDYNEEKEGEEEYNEYQKYVQEMEK